MYFAWYNIFVDRKNLELIINKLYPSFYSFALALIPDQLQARQIVVDSLELIFNKQANLMGELLECESSEEEKRLIRNLRAQYFKSILELGRKRFPQVEVSLGKNDYEIFYSLPLDARAVTYLKTSLKFNFNDIESITGLDRYAIMTNLAQSRNYLLKESSQNIEILKTQQV